MKLARLLGNDHRLFAHNFELLEKSVGESGIDVELLADMNHRAHTVMQELGLDSSDLTANELYHALCAGIRVGLLDDCQFVLYEIDGEVLSFNRNDVAINCHKINCHNNSQLGEQTCEQARASLAKEIFARYTDHNQTHNETVKELLKEIGLKI